MIYEQNWWKSSPQLSVNCSFRLKSASILLMWCEDDDGKISNETVVCLNFFVCWHFIKSISSFPKPFKTCPNSNSYQPQLQPSTARCHSPPSSPCSHFHLGKKYCYKSIRKRHFKCAQFLTILTIASAILTIDKTMTFETFNLATFNKPDTLSKWHGTWMWHVTWTTFAILELIL